MTRTLLALTAATLLLAPPVALAQDSRGAERIEIGSALFGGGLLMVPSADRSASPSRSYVLSGAFTTNVSRWIGLEGDIGVALGRNQAHSLYGVLPDDARPESPSVLLYSGNVVYNPFSSEVPIVPYLSVGAGALTTFALTNGSRFGLEGNTTYPMASVGGGVRWFPIRHWGVRGDYRFMGIRHDAASAPAGRVARSAHRVYGALIMTF
jgi:hypothetical protein